MDENVDLSKLKVNELKKLLKDKGLAVSGNKSELIARLEGAALEGETTEKDDQGLDEDLDQEDLDENILDDSSEAKENAPDAKKKEQPAAKDEKTETTGKPAIAKISPTGSADKLAQRAARFGAVSEQAKKALRAEKFGLNSEEKKKQKRAERFSSDSAPKSPDEELDVTDVEAKKAQRAARFGLTDASNGTSNSNTTVKATSEEEAEKLRKRAERFGTTASITVTETSKQTGSKVTAPSGDSDAVAKRKARFGAVTTGSTDEVEEKKRKRAERFA